MFDKVKRLLSEGETAKKLTPGRNKKGSKVGGIFLGIFASDSKGGKTLPIEERHSLALDYKVLFILWIVILRKLHELGR